MVHLNQLADRDFILVHHDQSVAQAKEVVQRRKPAAVIVRRWEGGALYHYLYSAQEFLYRLAHAADEQPLMVALQLHEWMATPVANAYQGAESAPSRVVVTDGGRVLGFYDMALAPSEKAMRNLQLAGTPQTAVSRWLQGEFPEKAPLGETASLLVSLLTRAGPKPALPVAVQVGAQLDIVVQAQSGFALEGPGEGSLLVTDEEETLPLQFKLRATGIGPARIRVLCFQGGQPLGALTLTPTVTPAGQGAVGQRSGEAQPLAPLAVAQPELTLLILEHEFQGKPAITIRLSALDPALGLNLKLFGPIQLRLDPLLYFQDFFRDIEGLPLRTAEEQAIAMRRLALKGAALFHDLLPEDLRVLLWSLRERIRTVQVLSDEPWIPWELLKLQGREDGRVVEGPHLCQAFAMTRWFPGIARQLDLRLQRMAVVVPTDSGLPKSADERAYLLSLANAGRQVTPVPATYLEVVDALSQGQYDGWHFTGHGQFAAPDPDRSAIKLERGQELRAAEIAGQVSNCGLAHPLVFLNACQTGQEALSLTGVGGWARRFIECGAAAFIGSLWSVYDEAACQFAKAFYSHLLAGESIAQAAKEARAAIRPLKDPTWLAYTVFADPLAVVR